MSFGSGWVEHKRLFIFIYDLFHCHLDTALQNLTCKHYLSNKLETRAEDIKTMILKVK